MTMNGNGYQDRQVIDLLGKLRDAGPEYPPQLMSKRRAAVLASLALLPLAAGALVGVSWIDRLIKLIKGMSLIDKIVLGVEVAAITGLTGYGAVNAYIYRDVLKQMLLPAANTPFPTLSVPSTLSGGQNQGPNAGTPGGTGTPTGTPTPFPTWTGIASPPPTNVPLNGTPVPPTSVAPTNPPKPTPVPHGTKAGFTPKPERSPHPGKTPKP